MGGSFNDNHQSFTNQMPTFTSTEGENDYPQNPYTSQPQMQKVQEEKLSSSYQLPIELQQLNQELQGNQIQQLYFTNQRHDLTHEYNLVSEANNHINEDGYTNVNDNKTYEDSNLPSTNTTSTETERAFDKCYFKFNFGEDCNSCEGIDTFYSCMH